MKFETLDDVYKKVSELERYAKTIRGKKQTIENIALKTMEELGELAADLLKLNKFKVSDEKPKDITKNLKEEIVDGLIMYMTFVEELNIEKEELMKIFVKKITKWEKNHLNPKNQ